MSDDTQRRWEFQLTANDCLQLVDYETGNAVAGVALDLSYSRETPANLRATERACRKVFGGHHWRSPEMQLSHTSERRICKLCGRVEKRVEKWVEDESNEVDADD